MATDDIHPIDESDKSESASSFLTYSCNSFNKVMATDHVRISIYESVEGQCNSSTHTQPQACNPETKSLAYDLSQPSKTSSDPTHWTMFKVPYRLRQVNNKAYEPRIISIGPYYQGREHLKMMEIIKESCFRRITRENMDRAKEFVRAMKDMEEDVRKCYPEAFDRIDSDAFVKMMILDGCFIVDLFQNYYPRESFFKPIRIRAEIYNDLLLLENQLPFYVLSKLYAMIKMPNVEMDEFARLAQMDEFARLALSNLEILVPKPVIFPKKFPENIKDLLDIKHLLGLVHDSWIPHHTRVQGKGYLEKPIRCATELDESGIKFVTNDENGKDEEEVKHLFDVEFRDAKLKIPTLYIDDNIELFLRNFMAYEQFMSYQKPTYVCDYVVFMDNLINSGKDVQLLRHSGVIVNYLGDDEAVSQMFNKLRDFTYTTEHSFYYKEIYDKVNEHCGRPWNKWMATLSKDYFNTPWSRISVCAAAFLLLLTVLQSIFSVLSYVYQ